MVLKINGGPAMHRLFTALSFLCALLFVSLTATVARKDFIKVPAGTIRAGHVRSHRRHRGRSKADQTVVISGGRYCHRAAGSVQFPADANHMDFTGYSALREWSACMTIFVIPRAAGLSQHAI